MVVNNEEYETIHDLFAASTCRTFNEYARLVLLKKPIVIKIRNQSAEELLQVMVTVKNELERTANHFALAVKKLQSQADIAEIGAWCANPEHRPERLFEQVESIRCLMNEYYQLCMPLSI
jgi:hypothetical protein